MSYKEKDGRLERKMGLITKTVGHRKVWIWF